MSRASVDAAIGTILSAIESKQVTCLGSNNRYAQILPTHDEVPNGSVAVKPNLVRDIDITVALPGTLDFAFRVDEIQSDEAKGWVLRVWVKEGGIDYQKAWGYGLGTDETMGWTVTNVGPND
jgi:multidrug efflux pump subunit AcrA (membrane-fusion protein)